MKNCVSDSDILIQIKHLNKCLKLNFDKRLDSLGLTAQQGRVLFCINNYYEAGKIIHQSDLEDIFHLSKSTISEMISRLEALEFVTKEQDKPYFKLVPTQKVKTLIADFQKGKNETIDQLFKGFKKSEIKAANKIILKMLNNIDEEGEVCGIK